MRAAGLAIAAARAHLAIAAANRERWEIAAARDCWAIAAARACLANAAAPGDWGCVAAPGDWGCVAAPGDWGCVPPSPASWGALYPRRSVETGEKTNDTRRMSHDLHNKRVPLLSVTCRTASLSPLQSYPAIKKP